MGVVYTAGSKLSGPIAFKLMEGFECHPISDRVSFSLTAPRSMAPGRSYVLEVWAYLDTYYKQIIKRAKKTQRSRKILMKTKTGVAVKRGTTVFVRLQIPDFVVHDDEDIIVWDGAMGNATFPVTVSRDVTRGQHAGTVGFWVGGVQIAKLHFILDVRGTDSPRGELKTRGRLYRSAFASYTSEDWAAVLARVQGIKKVLPSLDVFLDVLSLRSGENWAERLLAEIRRRDTFYLFWSAAASCSEWVEREWRAALEHRGLEFINPVPLVPSRVAPPPKELATLHFNDPEVEYLEIRKADRERGGQ
jgi:hypothetical protein